MLRPLEMLSSLSNSKARGAPGEAFRLCWSFRLKPQQPLTSSAYCLKDFVVPNTRYTTNEVVTPGTKNMISEIAAPISKFGAPLDTSRSELRT